MRLRYRPFQAVAIALLSALITACACFAPLYDRAMGQALTDLGIEQGDPAALGLAVSGVPADADFFGADQPPPPSPESVAAAVPDDMVAHYERPILGYEAVATRSPGGIPDPRGPIVWRDDECAHVTFLDGGCPTGFGEVAVSRADVDHFGLAIGTTFRIFGAGNARPARLRVVGVYRPVADPFWFGLSLTGRSGLVDPAPPPTVQHDVWLTSRDTLSDTPLPDSTSTAHFLLRGDAVGVDDLLALGPRVDRLNGSGITQGSFTLSVHSNLQDLAHEVRDQIDQSRVTVPLLMSQLGLLAVVVLWLVLMAATEQRRPEVAVARLRGRGRRGARALLLGELLPVAVAGVVPGVLLALLGAWVVRTAVLPGHAPFELGLRLALAVAIALVVLVGVTLIAVTRVAREPVETLLRRVPPRRTGWSLGVGEALVIAGCGGVVVVFATGGLEGPIALAAPGLLAIVVGLLLAHLTTPVAAVLGRRLLSRGRVRAGVSVLDAARSPATRRVVAIVTLASALAVFSADALVIGERNRTGAAEQEAGAPLVAHVSGTDLALVRQALHDVDPDGSRVTPVVRIVPPNRDSTATLAVVPAEFSRIALFPGGAPSSSTWDRIRTPAAKPIRVSGTHLRLDIDHSTLESRRVDGRRNPLSFGVDLVNDLGETLHTRLGVLRRPTEHRRLGTVVGCSQGCFVTALWVDTLPGAKVSGQARLSHLTGSSRGAGAGREAQIGPARRWTEYHDTDGGSFEARSAGPRTLTIAVAGAGATEIAMAQAWLPGTVPALLAGGLPPDSEQNRFSVLGIDGEAQPAAEVAPLDRVPASGPQTAVVNLDLVERGSTVAANAQLQLWFADDDAAFLGEVEKALEDHGVAVASTSTLADVRRVYDESAAAWSIDLASLVGVAALLIALLVLVVSAVSSWRLRTRDLAALRMTGVQRRAIGSLAVAAQVPAVVLGVVAGTVSGLFGAHLALPIVPLFAQAPEVSTLDLGTAWAAVALAALASLVVLGLGAVAIGRVVARRSSLQRLREVGQ